MSSAITSTNIAGSERHVLSSRNFRLLWLGQAISTFGDKFTEIAVPILVYTLTGSAMQLGLAFMVQTVASLLFGLFAGVLTDRWNRKQTMVVSDILRAGLVITILFVPLLPLSLSAQLLLLYMLSFLAAAVKQFFLPAKIGTIPETVSESQLLAANSLDQSTMTLVGFMGFGLAGVLVGLVGVTAAFVIDGLTFLVSAVFIGMMRLAPHEPAAEPSEQPSISADIRAGFRHVTAVTILKGTLILSLFAPLALGATQALLLIFAQDVLHAGTVGFGLLEGIFGLGIAAGAFVLARYGADVPRGRLLSWGVIGMGLGQLVAVGAPMLVDSVFEVGTAVLLIISLPFFFLGAACNAAIFIGIRTIVQENTPGNMIGRVFSVIMVVSSAAMALGASMAGLADIVGVGMMLGVWALVLILVGTVALRWPAFQEA